MPIVLGLVLFVFILRQMDEFRRLLSLSAFALSSAIVGIVVHGWSLLAFVGVGGCGRSGSCQLNCSCGAR